MAKCLGRGMAVLKEHVAVSTVHSVLTRNLSVSITIYQYNSDYIACLSVQSVSVQSTNCLRRVHIYFWI